MKRKFPAVHEFCEKHKMTHYTVGKDGTIEAHRDVIILDDELEILPFKFSTVYGSFHCYCQNLVTFENMPDRVTMNFTCEGTKITSLKGIPHQVGGQMSIYGNQITSLDYFPLSIGSHLYLQGNPLVFDQKCIDMIQKILSSYKLSYVDCIEHLLDAEQYMEYHKSKRLITIQNIVNS